MVCDGVVHESGDALGAVSGGDGTGKTGRLTGDTDLVGAVIDWNIVLRFEIIALVLTYFGCCIGDVHKHSGFTDLAVLVDLTFAAPCPAFSA